MSQSTLIWSESVAIAIAEVDGLIQRQSPDTKWCKVQTSDEVQTILEVIEHLKDAHSSALETERDYQYDPDFESATDIEELVVAGTAIAEE